jgi:hypothetical protein
LKVDFEICNACGLRSADVEHQGLPCVKLRSRFSRAVDFKPLAFQDLSINLGYPRLFPDIPVTGGGQHPEF